MSVTGLTFTLNGRPVDAAGTPATRTLLQFVRDRGLVGTKEGCGDGDCGACTVALAATEAGTGPVAWTAVNSCLVPIGSLAGRDVLTVEGISEPDGPLHPVQQAMVETAGSQCGYCTPGFVMSLFAGYHDPSRAESGLVDAWTEGNLCRCTGYAPIRRAAASLGAAPAPARAPRPARRTAGSTAAGRTFHHPRTMAEALDTLAAEPDAVVIAGGTDLGVELSHRRLDPAVMVALDGIAELRTLDVSKDEVRIGAGLPLTSVERQARGLVPALDEMIHWFAARQIRNRATIGGNLVTASPIGDLPPVLLALDSTVTIAGPDGEREVALDGFFTGYRTTVLAPGEIVTAVAVPRPVPGTHELSWSYKVGKRGTDDISVVAAAFRLVLDGLPGPGATITSARLAYGGVAATPARAHEVEEALVGRHLDAETVASTTAALRTAFTPLDDLRGSAHYRQVLVGNLFAKFVTEFGPGTGHLTEGRRG